MTIYPEILKIKNLLWKKWRDFNASTKHFTLKAPRSALFPSHAKMQNIQSTKQ